MGNVWYDTTDLKYSLYLSKQISQVKETFLQLETSLEAEISIPSTATPSNAAQSPEKLC